MVVVTEVNLPEQEAVINNGINWTDMKILFFSGSKLNNYSGKTKNTWKSVKILAIFLILSIKYPLPSPNASIFPYPGYFPNFVPTCIPFTPGYFVARGFPT